MLEDHPAAQHLAGVAHHEFQQLEFHGQQLYGLAVAPCFALDQVELQVADLQPQCLVRLPVPAQQYFDSDDQLLRLERLDDVVVATAAQSRKAFAICKPSQPGNIRSSVMTSKWPLRANRSP